MRDCDQLFIGQYGSLPFYTLNSNRKLVHLDIVSKKREFVLLPQKTYDDLVLCCLEGLSDGNFVTDPGLVKRVDELFKELYQRIN